MAAGDAVATGVGSLFSGLLNFSSLALIAILVFFIVLGGVYYFFNYRRKFNILVKIYSERAKDPSIYFDYGAMLKPMGKDSKKYFKLLKTKVELPLPPYKVMVNTNKGDYLEIWRKSEDEFVFLTQPKIDKEFVIRADGKKYPMSQTKQRHFESDIEWAISRKEESKKILNPESLWITLLTYAPQIVSSVFLLIILWIFMQKLPPLIAQLTELAKTLNTVYGATG